MTDLLRQWLTAMFVKLDYSALDDLDTLSKSVSGRVKSDAVFINADKVAMMKRLYEEIWSKDPEEGSYQDASSPFFAICHYTQECLVQKGDSVFVKLPELFRWRELAWRLGEELLVCSHLANKDKYRKDLSYIPKWNITCPVDDAELTYIYHRGLADLHHHLKASTDMFSLTWICLMNHITKRGSAFRRLDSQSSLSLYRKCYEAAYIRLSLFRELSSVQPKWEYREFDDISFEEKVQELQYQINDDRNRYGALFQGTRYDYALSVIDMPENPSPMQIYDGEKKLLYGILRKIYENPVDNPLTLQLYRYVLIKTQFRDCFVQTNKHVGFSNFSEYERRKDIFIDKYPTFKQLALRLAVCECAVAHKVGHLETRIAPKTDSEKMESDVSNILKIAENENFEVSLIYHYIKRDENNCQADIERHHSLRSEIKRQTLNIACLRRKSRRFYTNLVGIDAANTELDCRPEVFAQSFRYIRGHNADCFSYDSFLRVGAHPMHFTYHVGEDYYDIIDGLRAIDEAICFLHLQAGDRLGHCLALGVDAKNFYAKQNDSIPISKQYLLDNCAWMLWKCRKMNIRMSPQIELFLTSWYERLLMEIYNSSLSLERYVCSMRLRGDCPNACCYPTLKTSKTAFADWHSFDLDDNADLQTIRKDIEARKIYSDYHFNETVKTEGRKVIVFRVMAGFADLVTQLQEVMMAEIEQKGLVIECCPSSNYKIGFNDQYDQHPIFRFCGINEDAEHHIPVTINTDDLGIFHTSLDNEFSLIALAALKQKDSAGNYINPRFKVFQWLERIRENGFKYSFSEKGNFKNFVSSSPCV